MAGSRHVTFSGHETFTFRYGWLKKGVDGVHTDPLIFTRDDATTRLGVGKNMVKSVRHWCLKLGLIEESATGLRVSDWGSRLLAGDSPLDPYLEDPSSLWLLHWNLVSGPEAPTTWYWVFNELRGHEFSKRQLVQGLHQISESRGNGRSTTNTIKRDVDCFIRTYVANPGRGKVLEESLDCPLVELELVHAVEDGEVYRFTARPNSTLSDAVLGYCVADYWSSRRQGKATPETLPLEELCYGVGSPGRAFRLSEGDILNRAERLAKSFSCYYRFADNSGLKQLLRTGDPEDIRQALLAEVFNFAGHNLQDQREAS